MNNTRNNGKAWAWVPSLYFAEGLPYITITALSVIFYKRMGISNADIALYTSWLYLPWVIKPFWSPVVDLLKTKRYWIVIMQLLMGVGLAGLAFTIPTEGFFQYTMAFFWLLAFSSATHDIAADGFYMLGLSQGEQSFFVGIRSTFYRIAMLTGQGLLVMLAGWLETNSGLLPFHTTVNNSAAWVVVFCVTAITFVLFSLYHWYMLPHPPSDIPTKREDKKATSEFIETFVLFFKKKQIVNILLVLLFYRLGESQLVKIASPFLLDSNEKGGLGLSTSEIGFIYGTVGIIALSLGGIVGGIAASRNGLKYWFWWMVAAINLPNAVYVFLAYVMPSSLLTITISVAVEQFGYGFGFTAFMLYMIYICEGKYKTAHFAITTGFMALGMMLPGMISGKLQEVLGYQHFFVWVVLCSIPMLFIVPRLRIDSDFGKSNRNTDYTEHTDAHG